MRILIACILWLSCIPIAYGQGQASPSFDCAKASTHSERLICADPELSARDAEYAALYKRARQIAPDAAAFKAEGLAALKRREANCKDKPCLLAWYAERKRVLTGTDEARHQIAVQAGPIRKVDFRNFTYQSKQCAQYGIPGSARLRNGTFAGTMGSYSIARNGIVYSDIRGDGNEDAIVHVSCDFNNEKYSASEIFVYSWDGRRAVQVARLGKDDVDSDYRRLWPDSSLWNQPFGNLRADGNGLAFSATADGPYCCPKYKVTFQYRWNGSRFMLADKPQRSASAR